ncbi:energy transducer TonB [Dechloromonas denitrificans]|uniref:energy transducer TonB n=1 Tax=Dechloromonas denitrificans TaxID=281362 RepID=UPI000A912044|nr:TonB family protein [Dechloromonas denitrificans]
MSALALRWQPRLPDNRRLWIAIGSSLLFHALLLTLHFKFPDASNAMREKALDIILVNAKSARKPHDAQALAQSNLDGGGNTDENRRAKTPLPPTLQQTTGNDLQQMRRRVQELEVAQQKMLTQARSLRNVASSQTANEQPNPAPSISGLDLAESARAMARLEGEISKTTDEYTKRPRKKFVGARAEEYRFAQYIEDWRQKIERIGTLNYPDAARGKLYGSLVLTVAINADGSIGRIDINRSSGHKLLDDSARRIVQMAGPYSPFPPDIRRDTDVLEITRTWYFTQGDQLSAK